MTPRPRLTGSVHPDVMAVLAAADVGHQPAYGADVHTARLRDLIEDRFGEDAEVYPVFNGSGANVVGLQAMCDRWSAVVCPESAHINLDECGAPEKVAGLKLIPVPTVDTTEADVDAFAAAIAQEMEARAERPASTAAPDSSPDRAPVPPRTQTGSSPPSGSAKPDGTGQPSGRARRADVRPASG
ncbi:beta-eliminating lyase [Pseudonocardia hierapolitana]|uniref:Beta-eliminating lyase n=1 Tax=Pseudonocardia hierapolitana TaxID=1128676 RepID=A0A561SII4_9PSEU|nr:beta-eliminating lyase-related protein [Pseudonocardia hierapolitana]TWF74686.1 beta-eliminating lyase [Pseudonocardia hierapolitana]